MDLSFKLRNRESIQERSCIRLALQRERETSPERDTRKARHRASAKKYRDANRVRINAQAWVREDRCNSSNYIVILCLLTPWISIETLGKLDEESFPDVPVSEEGIHVSLSLSDSVN